MKLGEVINKISGVCQRALEVVVCIILGFLVLDVLWGVFTRFVVGEQSRWSEEIAIYLLIWVSLLGAAVTYAENGHLGVDYFVQKMDAQVRRISEVIVHLIVLGFSLYGLLYGGWSLFYKTLQSGQVSSAIGIPMAIVYSAVPLCGLFFTLFALNALLGVQRSREPEKPEEIWEV